MHPLIPVEELSKLSDRDLLILEARLREIILTHDLSEDDLSRCLASLSNAIYVRQLRAPDIPGSLRPRRKGAV